MKKRVKIIILFILLVVGITSIFIIEKRKVVYNTCDGTNYVDWLYAPGALEYDVCVDKNMKGLFISREAAFERLKLDQKEVLNYIKDNSKKKLKDISDKNYENYVDFCKKDINESHEYYENCKFIIAFFDIYRNNFLKK